MRSAGVASGRRKKAARPSSQGTPRRKRQPRALRLALLFGGLLALAAGAWLTVRFQAKRAPADPILRMAAEDAFRTGLSLGGAGRHLAALPYFRRTVEIAPDSWTARANYASTLYNGAQEARIHLGKDEPATRSSLERIAMIEESLRQTDEASSWTREPGERAAVVFQRAQAYHTFGFALDALKEFQEAARLRPEDATLARASIDAETRLRSGGAE